MKRRAFVLVNRFANIVVRKLGLRRFRGGDLLFLTTVGRRSGQPRTTPLLYLEEDHGRWVVVASNGGADWQPGWWLNLRAGSSGEVALGGTTTPVTGAEITGHEREQLWQALNERVFDYDSYQRKVSRQLAVVRLSAVPS